jgi:hypothetical protein
VIPALQAAVDGTPALSVECPELGTRGWILGVLALQAQVDGDGQVRAILRGHATSALGPQIVPLGARATVVVALAAHPIAPPPPPLPPLGDDVARIDAICEGVVVATARLFRDQIASRPAPRAFGHVYCRWLRSGDFEAGWDLTDFASQPHGQKYQRLAERPLARGQVVTYCFATAWPAG